MEQRLLLSLRGQIQGVGFRPFVYRLATELGLVGEIKNTSCGVAIDIQGKSSLLDQFKRDLFLKKPERAQILSCSHEEAACLKREGFFIAESDSQHSVELALLPDTAICRKCQAELSDPTNRRFGYPFLHCAECGPRFTLFLQMPYDRCHTTMRHFSMCSACRSEYEDPHDRRFYAQTNCCPCCGPKLSLYDNSFRLLCEKEQALERSIEALRAGKIVAVKNTGGYLLLADANNADAIALLRRRKNRPKKPFALLVQDLNQAKNIAIVDELSQQLLLSSAAPIVLLRKRRDQPQLPDSVASGSPYYGVMLAHNALQILLLEKLGTPLIATSGNLSDEPLCISEEEAFTQLSSVADLFLTHNRLIQNRADDSIVAVMGKQTTILRRARGYTPGSLELPAECTPFSSLTLAVGGEQKSSFAWGRGPTLYLSQHMGNLDSRSACRIYDEAIENWEKLLRSSPQALICDKHPHYYTSHYAKKRALETTALQHHKAHICSCLADNEALPPVSAFSWDGTGYGEDATIWGGELFIVDHEGIRRFGSLAPFPLPGGEKAIREPRRSALGLLSLLISQDRPAFFDCWQRKVFAEEELRVLQVALENRVNTPLCSSMGRLFDAVSALLECSLVAQYEGEGALLLEELAGNANPSHTYRFPLRKNGDLYLLDWEPLLLDIGYAIERGEERAQVAANFHQTLAEAIVEAAEAMQQEKVVLTGGVMQNRLLVERAIDLLKKRGFIPLWHHRIPPNDGGIAVGQLMGASLPKREYVSRTAGKAHFD